jgi:hypothetical protein
MFSTSSCIGFKNSFSKTELSHGYRRSSSELHPVSGFEPQTLKCQVVGAAHEVLLYHTEVRWLSHGRVFSRVMELTTEKATFLREKKKKICVKSLKPKVSLCRWPILQIYSRI